ncbi:uncharacterized protein LOC114360068 [Ostrinia furnacalis]|uniref:uncharacterized protein LOC114360068 n=1 Tax=Ostrinia furnacalis TaxID=93504 RepID=UPI00103BA0F4|nr:uncharacterized protein LOC114360068 [Ostrinia furnacalis]
MLSVTARHYLEQARQHANRQNPRLAFEYYIKAVNLDPELRHGIENEYREQLTKYNEILAKVPGKRTQMYINYVVSMRMYPGNINILYAIGQHLMKNSKPLEALCHFEKIIQIDSNLVMMERNLDSAKKHVFEAENFRFLNDKKRKEAYERTINIINRKNNNSRADITSTYVQRNKSKSIPHRSYVGRSNIHDVLTTNKDTGQLELPDIVKGKTMLVMNKFGPGLFGNELLPALKTIWECRHFQDGRVTPSSAEFFVVGAKCDRLIARHQLGAAAKHILGVTPGPVHADRAESFHGQDVATFDDVEYVTEAGSAFKIDFNNYGDIMSKYRGVEAYTARLKGKDEDAEMNVLVGYFNLHMAEGVTLTTDPRSPDRSDAWPQAIFFDFIPRPIKRDDEVCVELQSKGGMLALASDTDQIARLGPATVAFLNDTAYVEALRSGAGFAAQYLSQVRDVLKADIADLCPFPVFGLFMLKRGARSLTCFAQTPHDRRFIERVFKEHGIEKDRFTVLAPNLLDVFGDKKFSAVVYNGLRQSGEIDSTICRIMYHLRVAHLEEDGLALPARVKLIAQLISSEKLDSLTKVCDEGPVARALNPFQASQVFNLDPTRLEYEALSDPETMADCVHHMGPATVRVEVTRDGECGAILCWYEIHLLDGTEPLPTNRRGSFVDSLAFLLKDPVELHRGDTVTLVRCVDMDGSFKLALDVDVL